MSLKLETTESEWTKMASPCAIQVPASSNLPDPSESTQNLYVDEWMHDMSSLGDPHIMNK